MIAFLIVTGALFVVLWFLTAAAFTEHEHRADIEHRSSWLPPRYDHQEAQRRRGES